MFLLEFSCCCSNQYSQRCGILGIRWGAGALLGRCNPVQQLVESGQKRRGKTVSYSESLLNCGSNCGDFADPEPALWMLVRYHDRFRKKLKFPGWSYFILMSVATAYEYMKFGLSLQTYAQTFSALVAFFVGEIFHRRKSPFKMQKPTKKEIWRFLEKGKIMLDISLGFLYNTNCSERARKVWTISSAG